MTISMAAVFALFIILGVGILLHFWRRCVERFVNGKFRVMREEADRDAKGRDFTERGIHDRLSLLEGCVESDLPKVLIVQGLNVEPGDVLVVTIPGNIHGEDLKAVSAHLSAAFPGHKIALMMEGVEIRAGQPAGEKTE